MTTTKQKPSEWLAELDSHSICYSPEAKADFEQATGMNAPKWPEYTLRATRASMRKRGLGGWLAADAKEPSCNAWEMAEATARQLVQYGGSFAQGRGRRFRDAIAALREGGF